MSNHYETLGVNKNCSAEEIKIAFRKLAREHHPDKGGDKEKFQAIQEAYEVLSDPEKRESYDNPSPFVNIGNNNGRFDFNFHSFFNAHMQPEVNKKGNHVYICKITLKDLYYGIVKNIRVTKNNPCEKCNITCDLCGGHGHVSKRLQLGPLMQILQQACIKCDGKGKRITNKNCNNCKGKETIQQEKIVEIKVERGSDSEQHIIVEGWGEQASKPNEVSGDLIINVTVLPHNDFTRHTNKSLDLIYNLKITLKESIVGKIITIPHFDGDISLNINSFGIINPNKQYTIFNKGLINKDNTKGNLHIRFEIVYPEIKINEEQINELQSTLSKMNF